MVLALARAPLSLVLGAALTQTPATVTDPYLALGIRQFQDGDFEAAVFTLDGATRRLSAQSARAKELAWAYVYLGAAYVGIDHEPGAKGKFREALRLDPELRLEPGQFSKRVMAVFGRQLLEKTAGEKKRGAKTLLIVGGVGAAAAVGVGAATRGTRLPPNRLPVAAFGIQPEGEALSFVTTMAFTASASDPDGDALSYSWDLGDGATASGDVTTHRYDREGTFTVRLTVRDGTGSSDASKSVTARSLTGTWRATPEPIHDALNCTQSAAAFRCENARPTDANQTKTVSGTLVHPRRVVGVEWRLANGYSLPPPTSCEVSSDLRLIDCVDGGGLGSRLVRQ